MPYEVDQEALDNPNLKILDMAKPPTRQIPHQEFPKMLYLHPKDKTKEHKYIIVDSEYDERAAKKNGFRTDPHVPVAPPEEDADDFESEVPEVAPAAEPRRGPGRPPTQKADPH